MKKRGKLLPDRDKLQVMKCWTCVLGDALREDGAPAPDDMISESRVSAWLRKTNLRAY